MTELPARTRQLLLLMALDGTGDLRVLGGAPTGTQGLEDLAPAERARLVSVGGYPHRLAFRHPLIRSAVVELATENERRRAHQVLAELWSDQSDRRAWHLAEASAGPDEDVAALLEQTARRIPHCGDATKALDTLTRAADLSPQPADRRRRLHRGGGDRRIEPRVGLAGRGSPVRPGAWRSAAFRGRRRPSALNSDADLTTAHRLLVGAIETTDHGYDAQNSGLIEALYNLTLVCFLRSGRKHGSRFTWRSPG